MVGPGGLHLAKVTDVSLGHRFEGGGGLVRVLEAWILDAVEGPR